MSIGRKSFFGQLRAGQKILEKERLRRDMIRAQEINSKPMATEKIYHHLKKLSGEE
jgi:processive 1,2-diacylglycerol beta-glucosyltransferase